MDSSAVSKIDMDVMDDICMLNYLEFLSME